MAKIDSLRLWRLRLSNLPCRPWMLALLLLGDGVELALSVALGAVRPPAPLRVHASYPTFDLPVAPLSITAGVAFVGVVLGLWMGAMLIAEIVLLIRRAQIMRYRYRDGTKQ